MKIQSQLAQIGILFFASFTLNTVSFATGEVTSVNVPTIVQEPALAQTPANTPVVVNEQPVAQQVPVSKEIVAKVVWVKGVFSAISPDQKTRALKKADPIYLNDTLTTDPQAKAQIVFTDNALMTFVPGTEFYVKEYKMAPDGKDGSYIMNLLKGGFRTITGLIAKANPEGYKVITPVATIGVRGTDYSVYLKDGELLIARHAGKPCVTSDNKEASTLCLDAKTKYAKAAEGEAPVPLEQRPDEFNQISQIDNVTFIDGGMTMPGGPGGILDSFCIQ